MNGFRKYMVEQGGNIDWCKPYVDDRENISDAITVMCGQVQSMIFAGEETEVTPVTVKEFAEEVNDCYDYYGDGWSDTDIALEVLEECSCSECPFFGVCEAMENPPDWGQSQLAELYPDD